MAHHNANLLSSDISRRNPQDEYELIQKIGSGTYGDVYKLKRLKVCETFRIHQLILLLTEQNSSEEILGRHGRCSCKAFSRNLTLVALEYLVHISTSESLADSAADEFTDEQYRDYHA
ncbi:Mitogen-activated protein kinase kinase kinase kinase 3 [Lucilia cuprina]|nr:Mitogen-activated protein kinase kinase kinase kinase 3 [Lucilia cuprina]